MRLASWRMTEEFHSFICGARRLHCSASSSSSVP